MSFLSPAIMSGRRTRATSPAKSAARPTANGKNKEQHSHGGEKSPNTREPGRKQPRNEKKHHPDECGSEDKPPKTPTSKQEAITGQSKTQTDVSKTRNRSTEDSHSRTREKRVTTPTSTRVDQSDTHDGAKNTRQSRKKTSESASAGKPQKTAKSVSVSGEQTEPAGSLDTKGYEKLGAKPKSGHSSATRHEVRAGESRTESARKNTSAVRAARGPSVDDTRGKHLRSTLEKLTIKKREQSNASSCVNDITEHIIKCLKKKKWGVDVDKLSTGSYYENVKICEPDEFDVMLTIPVDRVDIQKFDEAGAFYTVALKRHPNKHPLHDFLNNDFTIRASEMLSEFRDVIKDAVEELSSKYNIVLLRKKARCPAVTMEVKENGKSISVDFVLGLMVLKTRWPKFTDDGFNIEAWLGTKEKAEMKKEPFYLVPKYEGKGSTEIDGVPAKDVWRISFSHIEKEILRRHGHSKTCCEKEGQKCCRKLCLKLLKYLLQLLKEDDSKSKLGNFCSYHAKTTLLHAYAKRPTDSEWAYSELADCFQQIVADFVNHLSKRELPNFFIPSQNLLHQASPSSCDFLIEEIEFQRNNNFPIFGQESRKLSSDR